LASLRALRSLQGAAIQKGRYGLLHLAKNARFAMTGTWGVTLTLHISQAMRDDVTLDKISFPILTPFLIYFSLKMRIPDKLRICHASMFLAGIQNNIQQNLQL
jgi:hypothetical protein